MNVIHSLTYGDVKRMLLRRQQVPYRQAAYSLEHTKLAMQVYLAYRKLFPDDFKEKLKRFMLPIRLDDLRDDPKVVNLRNRVIDAVRDIFPIEEDAIFQNMDEGNDQVLIIEPQNYSMSWDELHELIEEPSNLALNKENWAFPMLVWIIGYSVDEHVWNVLSDNLGWNVKYPKHMVTSNTYVLMPRLRARLKKVDLQVLLTAVQFAWHDTGNYFIDYDPYDETNYDPAPPFTAESICELKEEYDQAKPIIAEYDTAMKLLRVDPSIYQTLVDLMGQSLEER